MRDDSLPSAMATWAARNLPARLDVAETAKLLVGSLTTSAAIIVGGLSLIILPTLIVGNELLILAGVASAVGLWFLAHRHGQLRGLLDAAESAVIPPPDNSGKAGGA